jgi:hypothetical protein
MIGRIIKVTYAPTQMDDCPGTPDLAKDEPLWAIVTEIESNKALSADILVCSDDAEKAVRDEDGHGSMCGWTFQRGWDVWRAVPEKQVPDKVWAALAKLRLLGEPNE